MAETYILSTYYFERGIYMLEATLTPLSPIYLPTRIRWLGIISHHHLGPQSTIKK